MLYRSEATITGALSQFRKGAVGRLGAQFGAAAVLKLLRLSMRLRSGPKTSRDLDLHQHGQRRGGRCLTAAGITELLTHMDSAGVGDRFVSELERGMRFSREALVSRGHHLKHIYLGERGGWLVLPGAEGARRHQIEHEGVEPLKTTIQEMWMDISNDTQTVAQYAEKHLLKYLAQASLEPPFPSAGRPKRPLPSPLLREPTPVAAMPPVPARKVPLELSSSSEDLEKYVVPLSSIRPKPGMVPLSQLPSRQQATDFLGSVAGAHASHSTSSRKAPHGIAVIAGESGIGKSELILDWVCTDARRVCPDFLDVLYITNCAAKTEDEVCAHVQHYLNSSVDLPLIVLDGLQLNAASGALAWTEGYQSTQSGLVQTLLGAVGRRSFSAVLGVRTSRGPNVMPAGLGAHPDIPELRIAECHWLAPFTRKESATFLRELPKYGTEIPDYAIKKLVQWGRGNPLFLTLTTSTSAIMRAIALHDHSNSEFSGESQQAVKAGVYVREVLKALDRDSGGQYAAMRFVSLFRSAQPVAELQAVLEDTIASGQHIGRLTAEKLRQEIEAQTLFGEGPGGTVELHAFVKDMLTLELDGIVSSGEDKTMCAEIKALHLTAARRAWDRLTTRTPGGSERAAKDGFTQADVDLAFDCIHHLLGTRSPHNSRAPTPKTNLMAHVLQGKASNEVIESVCLKHFLHERKILGNSLAARGLFGHRLATLHRFAEWPESRETSVDSKRVRLTVRYELGTCSMVAGALTTARSQLALAFQEVRELQSSSLDAWFFKALRGASMATQAMQDGLVLCDEYSKVVSAYATVLFRFGEIEKARETLTESLRQFVPPIEEILAGDAARTFEQQVDGRRAGELDFDGELESARSFADGPPLSRNDRATLLRCRRRVITRWAEMLRMRPAKSS